MLWHKIQGAGGFGGVSNAWDLAYASYSGTSLDISANTATSIGFFFKPDGTKMYFADFTPATINEYSLNTAWNLSTASYVRNFSVSTQEAQPRDVAFNDVGDKMFVVGSSGDKVHEYTLSTDWNISTASFSQDFSVASQETTPTGIFFKPDDGTKMYISGDSGNDINEYSLSTGWNVSTASYVRNFSVSTQDTSPQSVFFKPDGTKMFVIGGAGVDVNEYTLSTAWNISTASYVQNFSLSSQGAGPRDAVFNDDGTKMFTIDIAADRVFEYDIG